MARRDGEVAASSGGAPASDFLHASSDAVLKLADGLARTASDAAAPVCGVTASADRLMAAMVDGAVSRDDTMVAIDGALRNLCGLRERMRREIVRGGRDRRGSGQNVAPDARGEPADGEYAPTGARLGERDGPTTSMLAGDVRDDAGNVLRDGSPQATTGPTASVDGVEVRTFGTDV